MRRGKTGLSLAGVLLGGAIVVGAMPARAATVYEVALERRETTDENWYACQRAARLQYGDNVTLGDGAPRLLQSIVIPLTQASENQPTGETYSPVMAVTLYHVDDQGYPTTAIHTATATHTFTNYNPAEYSSVRPGVYNSTEHVTFDFSAENIVLPDRFAFGFYDTEAVSAVSGVKNGLSLWFETADPIDAFNSTQASDPLLGRQHLQQRFDSTWELAPRPEGVDNSYGYNLVAAINAIDAPVHTPEPASAALLSAGGAVLLRRRRV